MNPQNVIVAKNLYTLFESLPQEIQQLFLKRLFQEKGDELSEFIFYLICREAKEKGDFLSEEEARFFIEGLPKLSHRYLF